MPHSSSLSPLLLAFAEFVSVLQRESEDSRTAAFRQGAVVTLRGRPVMNRICSDSCSDVQTSRSAILLLSLMAVCRQRHVNLT